jgi:putative addiction module killer protein
MMITIRQTLIFRRWHKDLRDVRATQIISKRIERLRLGLFGDMKSFDGISELRIDYGPGYRLYFVRKGTEVIILLCGGAKGTQDRDIAGAKELAKEAFDGS